LRLRHGQADKLNYALIATKSLEILKGQKDLKYQKSNIQFR